jgi:flagellar biogenesis protein FliO
LRLITRSSAGKIAALVGAVLAIGVAGWALKRVMSRKP